MAVQPRSTTTATNRRRCARSACASLNDARRCRLSSASSTFSAHHSTNAPAMTKSSNSIEPLYCTVTKWRRNAVAQPIAAGRGCLPAGLLSGPCAGFEFQLGRNYLRSCIIVLRSNRCSRSSRRATCSACRDSGAPTIRFSGVPHEYESLARRRSGARLSPTSTPRPRPR
jgi:hypothetical protein